MGSPEASRKRLAEEDAAVRTDRSVAANEIVERSAADEVDEITQRIRLVTEELPEVLADVEGFARHAESEAIPTADFQEVVDRVISWVTTLENERAATSRRLDEPESQLTDPTAAAQMLLSRYPSLQR